MRKILLLFAALLTIVQARAYDALVDGIFYNLNAETHEAEVTYETPSYNSYSGDVVIPSSITYSDVTYSVTSIGQNAFLHCTGLTSIIIPEGVVSIGTGAFLGCSSLSSIPIPSSVTSIELQAFDGTAWLDSQPDGVVYAGNVAYCYKGTMPENTSITLEDGTVSISEYAFAERSELKSITIPNSVISIGWAAFMDCTSLTYITIPNSVTSIDGGAFGDCSSLTTVYLGSGIKPIGEVAFLGCTSLTSVISKIKTPYFFGEGCFDEILPSCILTVPYGTTAAYEASGWTTDVFGGGIVEAPQEDVTIAIGSAGIATYCYDHDLDFSDVEGLKAYIVSGFSPSTGTLTLTPVTTVPAGEGLLLKGAEGSYEVPFTTTDMYYSNLLKGVTTATEIEPTDGDNTNFILANGKHGIGFYTLSERGELAAGKAYLQLPTSSVSSLARAIKLVFGDEITGIVETEAETKEGDNIYYDLQGKRVENPTRGLYIVNGMKVFVDK